MKIFKAFLYASLLLSGVAVQAQTNNGPMVSPKMNGVYYVGISPYTTIQSTVTAACNSGVAAKVVISPNITPSDTISAVTSCLNVSLEDQRVVPAVLYSTSGTSFAVIPSAQVAATAAANSASAANAMATSALSAVNSKASPGVCTGTDMVQTTTVSGVTCVTPSSTDVTPSTGIVVVGTKNAISISVSPTIAQLAGAFVSVPTMQSSPTTYDGIARGLTGCGTIGCSLQVPSTYPFDAERGYTFSGSKQHVIDNRGGSNRHIYNDFGPPTYFVSAAADVADCRSHIGSMGNCRETDYNSTQPGYSLGPNGHATNNGWAFIQGHVINVTVASMGIKSTGDQYLTCTGTGDCHISYKYLFVYGGADAFADEGDQMDATHLTEPGTMYAGVVASVAGDTITSNVSGGSYADLGVGQRIVNMTTPLASGYITGLSSINDGNNQPYTILAIAGATVTPSTWWGQAQSAIDVPPTESTGSNTITTPVTVNFTTVGGSGSPAIGDKLSFAFDKVNTVTVTNVSTISGGYALTFGAYFGFQSGVLTFDTPWGPGGLELTKNTVEGVRYDIDVLGATDSTHIVAVQSLTGTNNQFSLGLADITKYQIFGDLSNTAGVTTIIPTGNILFNPKLANYPAITIGGATNSAFNTTCTNVGNVSLSGYASFQCTQAGVSGQTSVNTGSPYFTFGTSGYGTGSFILRRMARVVDIQTYAAGTASVPVNTQTLRLGANNINLSVGNSISMGHHYAMEAVSRFDNMDIINPYSQTTYQKVQVAGHGINSNFNGNEVDNVNPANMYAGFGGEMSAPHGLRRGGSGPWADLWTMDYAPVNGGYIGYVGPPLSTLGVADPVYAYNWQVFAGNGGNDAVKYTPYTRTLEFTMPKLKFANGSIPVAALVASSTTVNGTNCALGASCTLSGVASSNSPTFTGVPTAPTPAAGTNTTQIATMAAVQTAVASASGLTGKAQFVSGSYTATFSPAFASGTVGCTANDQTAAAVGVGTPTLTGTTFTGTGTDSFYYNCFLVNQALPPTALYNGVVQGTPTFAAAKFGNGLSSSSSSVADSNYIALPTGTFDFNAAGSSYSLDAQLKINSPVNSNQTYVAVSYSGSDGWIGIANGYATGNIGGHSVSCSIAIGDNINHYILAAVESTGMMHYFVDGVSCDTAQVNISMAPTSGYIGRYTSPGYGWPGTIDEVAIWNIATHTTNFTPPTSAYTGAETGLRALYHLQANGNEF